MLFEFRIKKDKKIIHNVKLDSNFEENLLVSYKTEKAWLVTYKLPDRSYLKQFTGLFDARSNKIFTGDILGNREGNGQVIVTFNQSDNCLYFVQYNKGKLGYYYNTKQLDLTKLYILESE